MGAKVLNKPKYLFPFENTLRVSCPVGSGMVPIYKTEKDPKTGLFHVVKCGESNRQYEMDEDAKGVNLLDLLKQVDAGKIKRQSLVYGDSRLENSSLFDAREKQMKVAKLWDSNPIIRAIYPTKDSYLKDIANGTDIEKKCKDFAQKTIETSEKAFANFKITDHSKEIKNVEPKKEPTENISKEVK